MAQGLRQSICSFTECRDVYYFLGIKLTCGILDNKWDLAPVRKGNNVLLGIGEPKTPLGGNFPVIKAYIPWDSNIEEVKEEMLLKLKKYCSKGEE